MDFKDKWAGEMTKVLKIPSSEAKQASGLVYFFSEVNFSEINIQCQDKKGKS